MSKEKIKSCAYVRVSTDSKDQLNSFENQKDFFSEYAIKHPEIELYKCKENNFSGIYADKGISGTLLKRDAFELMLRDAGLDCKEYTYTVSQRTDVDGREYAIEYKDYKIEYNKNAENPAFNEIFVKSTSRFSRNIMVAEILRKLAKIGVYVTFLDIAKTTRNPDDIFVIQLFQQFDELFSRDLSRKLIAANLQSAENEILRTNNKIYGFKYVSRRNNNNMTNNKLVKIEKESIVIEMIFRLYFGCFKVERINIEKIAPMIPCDFNCLNCPDFERLKESSDGIGFRNIVKILDEFDFKTRKGEKFEQSAVKHIFENEKHFGGLNNRKWDHGGLFEKKSTPSKREDIEIVIRNDLIEPIISKELFDACVHKREIKAGDSIGKFKGKPSEYKGLIKCGYCGNVYIHNKSEKGFGYYCCKTKKRQGMNICNGVNVRDSQIEDKLRELAEDELNILVRSDNIRCINTLVKSINEKIDFIDRTRNIDDISALAQTIAKDKRTLERLVLERAEDDYPETFEKAIQEIKTRLRDSIEKYDKTTKKPKVLINESMELLTLCFEIIELSENMQDIYTEDEVIEQLDSFVIYGEPTKINGIWQSSEPDIVPILKSTASAKRLLNGDIDITAPILTQSIGIFATKQIEELKDVLSNLDKKIAVLQKQYSE